MVLNVCLKTLFPHKHAGVITPPPPPKKTVLPIGRSVLLENNTTSALERLTARPMDGNFGANAQVRISGPWLFGGVHCNRQIGANSKWCHRNLSSNEKQSKLGLISWNFIADPLVRYLCHSLDATMARPKECELKMLLASTTNGTTALHRMQWRKNKNIALKDALNMKCKWPYCRYWYIVAQGRQHPHGWHGLSQVLVSCTFASLFPCKSAWEWHVLCICGLGWSDKRCIVNIG